MTRYTFDRFGLVGIGYVRTPFGKTHAGDDRNYWTLLLDSATFAGPVAYWLPELFAERRTGSSSAINDLGQPGTTIKLGS